MERRRLVTATLIALLLAACGRVTPSPVLEGSQGTNDRWAKLPSSPLSPRRSPHVFSVHSKLVVMGGTEAEPCPPVADCGEPSEPPLRSGAVYDPTTESWTPIADAPVPLGLGTGTVIGGRVFLLLWRFGSQPGAQRAFLSYDLRTDKWEELDVPSKGSSLVLASAGSNVLAYQSSQENGIETDLVYDPSSDSWSELSPDPLRPSFDRSMVWTDAGLVLLGIEVVPNPGSDVPAVYRAALLNASGRWTRLPDSEVIGWNPVWSWSAGRVVNASIESANGGEVDNWGRFYPAGGMLDPITGRWQELPAVPEAPAEFTGFYAPGERGSVAGTGWVYDAEEGRWLALSRPAGGPETEAGVAWVADRLMVWGGARFDGREGILLNEGWAWQAPW